MEISTNKCMLKGANGKYAGFYKSSQAAQARWKPIDQTPKEQHMTQMKDKCAAAYLCKTDMPLSTGHRCIICAFCMHPECGYELKATRQHPIPSTTISQICYACTLGNDIKKFVKNNEVSLGHYRINKFIRPQYPKIQLKSEESPNDDASKEKKDGSKNTIDDTNTKQPPKNTKQDSSESGSQDSSSSSSSSSYFP